MSRPPVRRMEMLDYIRDNPGQTRTQIAASTGWPLSAVAQCTKRLASQSMARAEGDGKARVEKRWYAVSTGTVSMGHAAMFRGASSIFAVGAE